MHFDYIIIHYINEDHTEPMVPNSPASPDPVANEPYQRLLQLRLRCYQRLIAQLRP